MKKFSWRWRSKRNSYNLLEISMQKKCKIEDGETVANFLKLKCRRKRWRNLNDDEEGDETVAIFLKFQCRRRNVNEEDD